jgi:carbohydrate diacid regulator
MIDIVFANKFIDKVTEYTDYNINIMNSKGIIIASKDKERIGKFHEIAYKIIQGEEDSIIVDTNNVFLGVKSGINMAVKYNKRNVGVIGITGNPKELHSIALIIKMAMEAMLEFEIDKEKLLNRENKKEQFLNYLLYGEKRNERKIKDFDGQLRYQEYLIRVPILIVFDGKVKVEEVLSKVKKGKFHTSQDICAVIGENQIIVFKHVNKEKEGLFSRYKYIIGEYLNEFLNFIVQRNIECKLYIGSFQTSFEKYSISYQHCVWLQKNIASNKLGIYFYDYIEDYMKSVIPVMELHNIFYVFEELMDKEFKEDLVEKVEALIHNNYNLVESSKELFIHKNTFIFHFNKIREKLDLNPMQKSKDRTLLNYLYYYIKQIMN